MKTNTHIYIDADSCPSLVRSHVVKMGIKYNLPVIFVANKQIPCDPPTYEMIICSEEKDAADNYIIEKATIQDIVITRDIVFADRLVTKKIPCLNDRGTIFSEKNIKELLADRDFNLNLAEIGLVKHYNSGYDKKKFAAFCNAFDKLLHQI